MESNLKTLNKAIRSKQYLRSYEQVAKYLRNNFTSPISLQKAEEVHRLLKTNAHTKQSNMIFDEYISSANILKNEYSSLGVLKDDFMKQGERISRFDLPFPELRMVGNNYPISHDHVDKNPAFRNEPNNTIRFIFIWVDFLTTRDLKYWMNYVEKNWHQNAPKLIFICEGIDKNDLNFKSRNIEIHVNYSRSITVNLLHFIDSYTKNNKLNQGKFIIAHATTRPSENLTQFCQKFYPDYKFIVSPKFSSIASSSGGDKIQQYIDKINTKTQRNRHSKKPYEAASLLFICMPIENLPLLSPALSIAHLQLLSTELFWRLEQQGFYFVSPKQAICELRADCIESLSKTFNFFHSSKQAFIELYPFANERKLSGNYKVPLINIYIPLYNSEHFIAESIQTCLDQDIKDLQICISDDGSTDASLSIAKKMAAEHGRILVSTHENSGISFTTNEAIQLGKAPFIGQLDSDDLLLPGAVNDLYNLLKNQPKLGCAYAACERINANGEYMKNEYNYPEFSRQKMVATSIVHHFRMFKRQYYNRTSRFNTFLTNSIDYDFFLKLSEVCEIQHLNKILYKRRWHGGNTSIRKEGAQTRNTYMSILNSLKRQGLHDIRPVIESPDNPRSIGFVKLPAQKKLRFYPDYSHSNPYQKLLYKSVSQEREVSKGTIEDALKDIETYDDVIFHLHWVNFLWKATDSEEKAQENITAFLNKLRSFKAKGGKIIWTVHNLLRHDKVFVQLDKKLRQDLCNIVDHIHLHDSRHALDIQKVISVPKEKFVFHPHGSYLNQYGSFNENHRYANLKKGQLSFVIFGQLRKYKDLNSIEAILNFADKHQINCTLAGNPENESIRNRFTDKFQASKFVDLKLKKIPNDDVHELLSAHDIGILSYENILTSGTLKLFQSYAMTLVGPDNPSMRLEISEGMNGFLYKNSDESSGNLEEVLLKIKNIPQDKLIDMCNNNYMKAQELNWTGDLENVWS